MKKEYYAVATMIGMIVGAGMLGIPYTFVKSGIFYGILNLLVIGFFVTMINLQLGEIILRTKGKHQLTGYAEKYLGRWGKELMMFAMIVGVYGAMIAYLIGSGETVASFFGGNPLFYAVIYFLIFSSLIYFGIKTVSRTEFFFMFARLGIFLAILISLAVFIRPENFVHKSFSLSGSFFPFGVVLFSLLGMSSIPEAREVLEKDAKKFKKVILLGSIIPIITYLLFSVFFVLAFGTNINEVATITLKSAGIFIFVIGSCFALIGMTTAYLANGVALQEMYNYDYRINRKLSFIFTCIVPLLIILLGVKSFIKTIGIAGAVSGGISAVLVMLMFYKAKKTGDRTPEYSLGKSRILSATAAVIFILGIAFEIISSFS